MIHGNNQPYSTMSSQNSDVTLANSILASYNPDTSFFSHTEQRFTKPEDDLVSMDTDLAPYPPRVNLTLQYTLEQTQERVAELERTILYMNLDKDQEVRYLKYEINQLKRERTALKRQLALNKRAVYKAGTASKLNEKIEHLENERIFLLQQLDESVEANDESIYDVEIECSPLQHAMAKKMYLKYIPLKALLNPSKGQIFEAQTLDEMQRNFPKEPINMDLNAELYNEGLINNEQMHNSLSINEECAIIDIETTGLNVANCGIVSLCIIVVGAEARRTDYHWPRIDPGKTINAKAIEVHGIHDHDVEGCLKFKDILPMVYKVLLGKRPIGYNIDQFDLPILKKHFEQEGYAFPYMKDSIDLYKFYKKVTSQKLHDMYQEYCQESYQSMKGVVHSARGDCLAVHNILHHLHSKHRDLPQSSSDLSLWLHDKQYEKVNFNQLYHPMEPPLLGATR